MSCAKDLSACRVGPACHKFVSPGLIGVAGGPTGSSGVGRKPAGA